MAKINRRWISDGNSHMLYGTFYGDEELIATMTVISDNDSVECDYVSEFMGIDDGFLDAKNIDDAKAILEDAVEEYLRDELAYACQMVEYWNDDDENQPLKWRRVETPSANGWTNTFSCPHCERNIQTQTYLSPEEFPDYEHCPYCGKEVN